MHALTTEALGTSGKKWITNSQWSLQSHKGLKTEEEEEEEEEGW